MQEEHSKTVAIMQKELTELRKENKHLKKVIKDGEEEFKNESNTHKDYNGEDMKLLRRLKNIKKII